MTEQRTTLGEPLPIVHGDGPEFLEVTLPESVCENVRALRHLSHRVVDLMVDHGHVDSIIDDLEKRLRILSVEITCDYVTDLIREAAASPTTPVTPGAKSEASRNARRRVRKIPCAPRKVRTVPEPMRMCKTIWYTGPR